MWSLWAAADIFLHGIFMVYLKITCVHFVYKKIKDISVTVPLLDSEFSGVYRPLIYMFNICLDSD